MSTRGNSVKVLNAKTVNCCSSIFHTHSVKITKLALNQEKEQVLGDEGRMCNYKESYRFILLVSNWDGTDSIIMISFLVNKEIFADDYNSTRSIRISRHLY